MTLLTRRQIADEGLTDWVLLVRMLEARFATGDFATGLEFVSQIGAAAEEADHHPDVTLTYPVVLVKLWSHDSWGVTERDVALARRVSEIAAELGVAATPDRTTNLELAIDTADPGSIGPFWAAVLGYAWDEEHGEVVDPDGRLPTIWFQDTEVHETPRQRWHPDIHVAPEVAAARIAAAIAAGGTLVSEEEAPSFTVLADAEGNRVCVCTWLGRAGAS